jgi:hypothetical protein
MARTGSAAAQNSPAGGGKPPVAEPPATPPSAGVKAELAPPPREEAGPTDPASVVRRTEARADEGPRSSRLPAAEAPRPSLLPPRSLDETPPTSVVVMDRRPAPLTGDSPSDRLSRPFLASEALMEDLAPVEPAGESARIWCAGLGLGFAVVGALPLVGLRPGGASAGIPSLVIGAIALVAALSHVTYRQRAVAMVVLGLLSGVVDLGGTRAALATGVGGVGWSLSRLVPAIAVAAALIFRSRYRAYAGARIFLGAALLTAVPFMIHAVLSFSSGFGPAQIGGLVVLAAVAASLTGFMGSETQGAGPYLGWGIVIAFAVELALRALWSPGALRTTANIVHVSIAATAFAGAAVLAALGLFQIAAWRFAADARRINLHPPASRPAPRRDDSDVDWTTRA